MGLIKRYSLCCFSPFPVVTTPPLAFEFLLPGTLFFIFRVFRVGLSNVLVNGFCVLFLPFHFFSSVSWRPACSNRLLQCSPLFLSPQVFPLFLDGSSACLARWGALVALNHCIEHVCFPLPDSPPPPPDKSVFCDFAVADNCVSRSQVTRER